MLKFKHNKNDLLALLETADSYPPEVSERLKWFIDFSQHRFVSRTCRRFDIARTTFYRWVQRFNPSDLNSLIDATRTPIKQRRVELQLSNLVHEARGVHSKLSEELYRRGVQVPNQPHPVQANMELQTEAQHINRLHRILAWLHLKRAFLLTSVFGNVALVMFLFGYATYEARVLEREREEQEQRIVYVVDEAGRPVSNLSASVLSPESPVVAQCRVFVDENEQNASEGTLDQEELKRMDSCRTILSAHDRWIEDQQGDRVVSECRKLIDRQQDKEFAKDSYGNKIVKNWNDMAYVMCEEIIRDFAGRQAESFVVPPQASNLTNTNRR
ncbi:hypothetical protein KJ996_06560 [Patescibacteria group bacterium]|nr:hypothetical protein [Patescibacteria group bacterium]